MKICITAKGDTLAAEVDPRFGRCQYFILADSDSDEFKAVANPNIDGMGGVGIQSAQFVAAQEAKAVLTGNVGPNAWQALSAAGIKVFTRVAGTVKEALDSYRSGTLTATEGPSVTSKFGMP